MFGVSINVLFVLAAGLEVLGVVGVLRKWDSSWLAAVDIGFSTSDVLAFAVILAVFHAKVRLLLLTKTNQGEQEKARLYRSSTVSSKSTGQSSRGIELSTVTPE